jgi:hypothetical protein
MRGQRVDFPMFLSKGNWIFTMVIQWPSVKISSNSSFLLILLFLIPVIVA